MQKKLKERLAAFITILALTTFAGDANAYENHGDVIVPVSGPSADNSWSVRAGCRMMLGLKTRTVMSASRIINISGRLPQSAGSSDPLRQGRTAAEIAEFIQQADGRMDFDGGSYINWNDENGQPGETVDWRLYDRGNFDLATGVFRFTSTGEEYSFKNFAEDIISAESDEKPIGLSLEISRAFHVNDNYGVNLSAEIAIYQNINEFEASGRVYEGMSRKDINATIFTFRNSDWIDDELLICNDGNGVWIGDAVPSGSGAVLNSQQFETQLSTATVGSSSKMIVDASLSGEMSVYEIGLIARPWLKLNDRLRIVGALGVLAVRSELDFDSEIIKNGNVIASFNECSNDWTTLLAAGCGFRFSIAQNLDISAEWLYRVGDDKIKSGGNIVDIETELGRHSMEISIGYSF